MRFGEDCAFAIRASNSASMALSNKWTWPTIAATTLFSDFAMIGQS